MADGVGSDRVAGLPPPTVTEDAALAAELTSRLPPSLVGLRSASVTDLLEPRRAFWRRTAGPVPLTPERRARLDGGRRAHRAVDRALPDEGRFEVRLRRLGVSARVDLLADVPVEIKTGEDAPPDDLLDARPEYLEQVAMYCGLLGRPDGRLVHVRRSNDGSVAVRALDVAFGEVGALRRELEARASALRSAVASGDPTGLAACRWFGRGCEFQTAGKCRCDGTEPFGTDAFREELVGVVVRGDIEARWAEALAAAGRTEERAERLARYRDAVYPRRAYFERTAPAPASAAARPAPGEASPSELYDAATGAVEGAPVGEVHRLPESTPGTEEDVVGWQGEPYLLRTSRAWARVRPEELLARFPQYALELGFRCAAAGRRQGRVVLAYERVSAPADRLQVLRFDFGDGVRAYAELLAERTRLVGDAVASRSWRGLPPCAPWMTTDCPYRAECGCPEELGRSQR